MRIRGSKLCTVLTKFKIMNYTLFRHLESFGFLIDIKIKIDQVFEDYIVLNDDLFSVFPITIRKVNP